MNRAESILMYNNLMDKFKSDCNGCSDINCKKMHEFVINKWYHRLYDGLHKNK